MTGWRPPGRHAKDSARMNSARRGRSAAPSTPGIAGLQRPALADLISKLADLATQLPDLIGYVVAMPAQPHRPVASAHHANHSDQENHADHHSQQRHDPPEAPHRKRSPRPWSPHHGGYLHPTGKHPTCHGWHHEMPRFRYIL